MKRHLRVATLLAFAAVIAAVPLAAAEAATETVLYSFQGGSDGYDPVGDLTVNPAGGFYLPTVDGGSSASGTIVQLTPPPKGSTTWGEKVIYNFTGGSDGAQPYGDLSIDSAGDLYGTARFGGAGFGTVYKLTKPAKGKTAWTQTVLYAFQGPSGPGADGAYSTSNVVVGNGVLYGNTYAGGTGGWGIVFELVAPKAAGGAWTEHIIHNLGGDPDGAVQYGGLIKDSKGNLYGATAGGGSGWGAVYKLAPPAGSSTAWKETVLFKLNGAIGYAPQNRLLLESNGSLTATTDFGGLGCNPFPCGSLFRINPPASGKTAWTGVALHGFTDTKTDGGNPSGNLIAGKGGVLYGTTQQGGAGPAGTVFELKPPAEAGKPWTQTILHSFTGGNDGVNPSGGLVAESGALYGTTQAGGSANGGTVFKIVP